MMVSVKNERGEEVTRQVVGVGALAPGEARTFSFAVEVFTNEAGAVKPDTIDEHRAGLPNRLAAPSQPAPPSAAARREALKDVNRS